MGGGPDTRQDALGDAFETVRVGDPVVVRQALARVEGNLFGASAEVVQFSRYLLLERVGQGGIGVVHAAYDPELDRRVAIKFLRRDGAAADDDARRRLIREAQAMAQVTHPNVAAVYDVGEFDVSELRGGEPDATGDRGVFIVMELLAGQNLHEWLTASPRAWRNVVEVFAAAGKGLAAAHDAGMIHRDFKPANVILTPDGRVVVLDFGLARAADAEDDNTPGPPGGPRPARTLTTSELEGTLTEVGSILGTPSYMAPEQHRGGRADHRSDQYSFCASLYRALVGDPPFTGTTDQELLEAKRKGLPATPPRAAHIPGRIHRVIRRGLDPEPANRYASMKALLADLDRGRTGRTRWTVAAALVSVILGGVLGARWAETRDERCTGASELLAGAWDDDVRGRIEAAFLATDKSYAPDALAHVLPELDRYAQDWAARYTQTCEATTVRGEQSTEAMDLTMACLRSARARLASATSVLAAADHFVAQRAHTIVDGLDPLERCTDMEVLAAGIAPPREADADAVDSIRERLADAAALRQAGRYADARGAVEQARTLAQHVEYGPIETEIALARARVMLSLEDYDAAETAFRDTIRIGSRLGQWAEVGTAAAQLMGLLGGPRAKPDEAMALRELARGLAERSGDAEAMALFHDHLATVLNTQGKFPEAEAEYRVAQDLRERTHGPDHLTVATTRTQVAKVLGRQGKYEEAERELLGALEVRERVLGPQHPLVPKLRTSLASTLMQRGKYDEALEQHRIALEGLEYAFGPESETVLAARENMGHVLDNLDRYDEAQKIYRDVLEVRLRTEEKGHPKIAYTHLSMAVSFHAAGDYERALPEAREAATLIEKALGSEHPHTGAVLDQLAEVLERLDQHEEALVQAERAWAILERDEVSPRLQASGAFTLGRLLWVAGKNRAQDRKRARELITRAHAQYAEIGAPYTSKIEKTQRWLEEHE